jgi:hypothetical protein
MVPDRAGADTRVDVGIPLSALRGMDGASLVEEAWLRARAGQPGYLADKDAEVIACDALIVPIVTGSPQWGAIGQMITLVTDAYGQLLCQYHHDICIHRWGWEIELLPNGSVRATGPSGQIIQSRPPPVIPTS